MNAWRGEVFGVRAGQAGGTLRTLLALRHVVGSAWATGRATGHGFRAVLQVDHNPCIDAAIFEGVKSNDSQASAWSEELQGLIQRGVELLELIVDRDADGLEAAGRGMRSTVVIAACLGDALRQREGAVPRSPLKDGSGDASSPRLFAVGPEYPRELIFVHLVQPAACVELLVGVHPHVEWTIPLK